MSRELTIAWSGIPTPFKILVTDDSKMISTPQSLSSSIAHVANFVESNAHSSTTKTSSISFGSNNETREGEALSIFAPIARQNRSNCLDVTLELRRAIAYNFKKSLDTDAGHSFINFG